MNEQRRGPGRPPRDHENKQRPPRVPMSSGNKLRAPKREGYQRYWAVDRPGDIEQMKAAWWDFVLDENGEKKTIPAGRGETHYLMEIEQKYYDEDRAAEQRRVTDTTMQQAQTLGDSEYVPMGRKQVAERDII